MKFHVHTTGCKANQWDSRVMAAVLKRAGFEPASADHADVVIVNACTITGGAERDVRHYLNRIRRLHPSARVVLAGCHSQAFPERTFGADLVVGQKEKFNLPDFLGRSGVFVDSPVTHSLEPVDIGDLVPGRTRVFLKIQDGCDRGCFYCIVPKARGVPRSRPAEEILGALEGLHRNGVQEVVLTGIEVSAYRDNLWELDLKGLLALFDKAPTPPRIRLSSVDPRYIDESFVDVIRRSTKLAPSIHIPLQSGCDRVLSRMNRQYDTKAVWNLVSLLQSEITGIGIGLDVIAGFPGETDEEFAETYRFLEALNVYYLHVFPFSPREGTVAWSMDNQVAAEKKRDRVRLLKKLDSAKRRGFYGQFLGKTFSVVVEGKQFGRSFMKGFTDNYIPVYVPSSEELAGSMVQVRLTGIDGDRVQGDVVVSTTGEAGQEGHGGEHMKGRPAGGQGGGV